MNVDLHTWLLAVVVLCVALSGTILVALQGRLSAEGVLRRWVEALVLLGALTLFRWTQIDSPSVASAAAHYIGVALVLALMCDAIARLGGNRLPAPVVLLPPLVLAVALLLVPHSDAGSRTLLYVDVTGMQMLAASLLALLPSKDVSLRGRVTLFVPAFLGGLVQMWQGIELTLQSLAANDVIDLMAERPFSRLALTACLVAATLAVVLIDLERADRAVRRQARRDPLTGLLNRRTWAERVQLALERATLDQQRLTVVVVAIDHMRALVREEGRSVADRALVNLARSLVDDSERKRVFGGRLNGELLALAWVGKSGPGAERIEQLCLRAQAVSEQELGVALRVSRGVARSRRGESLGELLARADRERIAALREAQLRSDPSVGRATEFPAPSSATAPIVAADSEPLTATIASNCSSN